jgi:glucose-6-phosphate isomerase
MYDFVGGRFSMWGSVGLSISISVGYENFEMFLKGAEKMDNHFKETPIKNNIPVCLALIGIWNGNFLGAHSQGIIPYSEYLNLLPNYLQQSMMESNGKNIDRSGNGVDYSTGKIIWGGTGTNTQHAFFQLIHQGNKLIPCDFIGFKKSLHGNKDSHNKLMSNYIGQMQALMKGRSLNEVIDEMQSNKQSENAIKEIANFKVFSGNKPTTSILIDKLSPESLGMLIAMYEHIVFTKGVIWNIFSFDQWGVELGKILASKLLTEIQSGDVKNHDDSTNSLLKKLKN